jgi:acetolactate synthase-1/2/3 large subunit
MTTHRGADAVVATLAAHGVKRIFTLSGNHVMPIFDASLGAGIELVHVRHEAAAVHMADAWARLTGEIGVALVTGGPGHANAVGALYTALMADAPVLLLSGHAPTTELGKGAFQEMRQAEMAQPVTKGAGMGIDVDQAIRLAMSWKPGPVSLSLPQDLLEASAAPGATPVAMARSPIPIQPFPHGSRLAHARRPLILCGRLHPPGLEDELGIPVIPMESPRGVADPSLGAFAQILAKADCILLVSRPLDFTLRFGKAFAADCEILEANAFPLATTRHPATEWREEVRAALAWRPPEWSVVRTVQFLQPLQAILDEHPDSVFVSDGGEFGQWAQACLTAPNRVINGAAGSIGAALPFALAARVAKPGAPVIAVMGDGTFGFHPAEIDTAVRHKLPFVLVVGNDARWNAEYQIQLRTYGRERLVGCGLLPTRYDEVARAFGGYGELVTDPREMLPAARRAIASGLPAVLNVTIDGLPAPVIRR